MLLLLYGQENPSAVQAGLLVTLAAHKTVPCRGTEQLFYHAQQTEQHCSVSLEMGPLLLSDPTSSALSCAVPTSLLGETENAGGWRLSATTALRLLDFLFIVHWN